MISGLKKRYYEYCRKKNQSARLVALAAALGQRRETVLVHQLGRAGSMSAVNTLRSIGVDAFHTHWLNPETVSSKLTMLEAKGAQVPFNLSVSKTILDNVPPAEMSNYPWKLVSIIREPVGRNVSSFFLNIHLYVDNLRENYAEGRISCQDLTEIFLKEVQHKVPLEWFDKEVSSVFGVDIYEKAFPFAKGYMIESYDPVNVMVVRVEDLNNVYSSAFNEMFGVAPEGVVNTHISTGKDEPYAKIYKEFLAQVKLPAEYLSSMYESKYARHFYTDEEIQGFYKRWSEGKR